MRRTYDETQTMQNSSEQATTADRADDNVGPPRLMVRSAEVDRPLRNELGHEGRVTLDDGTMIKGRYVDPVRGTSPEVRQIQGARRTRTDLARRPLAPAGRRIPTPRARRRGPHTLGRVVAGAWPPRRRRGRTLWP